MSRHAIAVALALALGACASLPGSDGARGPRAPLELRQVQTRTLEAADTRLVLKAALGVLQDEGFVIREANSELGLLTAVLERQSTNQGLRLVKWAAILSTYGLAALLPWHESSVSALEANVNVTAADGERTRVRISLIVKVTDTRGNVRKVRPVTDAMAYQRLFAGLDKGLFLQKEGL